MALKRGIVELVDYDSNWDNEYRKEEELLRRVLKNRIKEIHHIGSTSIPGLKAKPIIDILIVIDSLNEISEIEEILKKYNYENYQTLLLGNSIFCSALYRKDDCISIGGYDEDMKLGYEDWEFYIRLLNESSVVYQIPEVLFSYRKKEISMVTECEKRIADVHNYIFAKNIDKYQVYFGSAIDSLRNLIYYRRKVEKYKRKWYRRLFLSVKALFHR